LGAALLEPAPDKGAVLFYLVLIHLLAIIGLTLFPLPSLKVLGVAVFFAGLGGSAPPFVTIVCSRTALEAQQLVEHFLIFCAIFNSSGLPRVGSRIIVIITPRADTPDDISAQSTAAFGGPTCAGFISLPRPISRSGVPS